MPISQEIWCQQALMHVFVVCEVNSTNILKVIKHLYPKANLPIEYKRKLLKGLTYQQLD